MLKFRYENYHVSVTSAEPPKLVAQTNNVCFIPNSHSSNEKFSCSRFFLRTICTRQSNTDPFRDSTHWFDRCGVTIDYNGHMYDVSWSNWDRFSYLVGRMVLPNKFKIMNQAQGKKWSFSKDFIF